MPAPTGTSASTGTSCGRSSPTACDLAPACTACQQPMTPDGGPLRGTWRVDDAAPRPAPADGGPGRRVTRPPAPVASAPARRSSAPPACCLAAPVTTATPAWPATARPRVNCPACDGEGHVYNEFSEDQGRARTRGAWPGGRLAQRLWRALAAKLYWVRALPGARPYRLQCLTRLRGSSDDPQGAERPPAYLLTRRSRSRPRFTPRCWRAQGRRPGGGGAEGTPPGDGRDYAAAAPAVSLGYDLGLGGLPMVSPQAGQTASGSLFIFIDAGQAGWVGRQGVEP